MAVISSTEAAGLLREVYGVLDTEDYVTFRPLFEMAVEVNNQTVETRREVERVGQEQLTLQHSQLLNQANWDIVVERYAQSSVPGENVDFEQVVIALSHPLPTRAEDIMQQYRELADYYTYLKEHECLLEKSASSYEYETMHGDIVGAIGQWRTTTAQAFSYMSEKRQHVLRAALPTEVLDKMTKLAQMMDLDGEPTASAPKIVVEALGRKLNSTYRTFDQQDMALITEERRVRPNSIMIGHQKLVREVTDIEDPRQWTEDALKRFPDWYTQGLGFVDFVEQIGQPRTVVNKNGTKTVWATSGHILYQENKVEISTAAPSFREAAANMSQAQLLHLKERRGAIMKETTDHELTHYAHMHALPVEWLRGWLRAMRAEASSQVTPYVARHRQESSRATADREDLCESVMLYKNDPASLAKQSMRRFMQINLLLNEYDPAVEQACYEVIGVAKRDATEVNESAMARAIARHARRASEPSRVETTLSIYRRTQQEKKRLYSILNKLGETDGAFEIELRTVLFEAYSPNVDQDAVDDTWHELIMDHPRLDEYTRIALIATYTKVRELESKLAAEQEHITITRTTQQTRAV